MCSSFSPYLVALGMEKGQEEEASNKDEGVTTVRGFTARFGKGGRRMGCNSAMVC